MRANRERHKISAQGALPRSASARDPLLNPDQPNARDGDGDGQGMIACRLIEADGKIV